MFGAVAAGAVFPIMFAVFGSLTDVFNREAYKSEITRRHNWNLFIGLHSPTATPSNTS